MKIQHGVLVGVLVILPSGGNVCPAAEPPARGEAVAVVVEQGPACDGRMADALWQKCPPWPMGDCVSGEKPRYATFARVLFDATHVHVGVYCEEPDTGGLKSEATNRDDQVWADDSVEIFLRADAQQPYCQFAVNPRGTLYDARDKQAAWNSAAEAKAAIQPGKAWTVTLKVPLKDLDAYVGEGQMWTMNIYRSRPARGGVPVQQYSWSIMSDYDYHAALEFGLVTGIDVPRRDDGVTRVRSAPAPSPAVLVRGKESGGVRVYYKMSFNDSQAGFAPDNEARLSLVADAVHGQALRVECPQSWSAAQLPIGIAGSRELKMALLMKGDKLPFAGVNVADAVAGDNTTSYAYRYLDDGVWTPIVYFLDRFRYNSRTTGYVSPQTIYRSVRLYGPTQPEPGTRFAIDNFVIYRGNDRQPPEKVSGLKATAERGGIQLSWEEAADNVGPQVYVIARADAGGRFQKMAESRTTQFTDTTAGQGRWRYRVFAADFEENFGPWSDSVEIQGASTAREPNTTREVQDRLLFADHVRAVHARGVGKVRKNHAALFGDSLTAATSYPQCAASAFGTLTVDAFGYPSMRTNFGRDKIQEILDKQNPEFLFVLYGTNNNKAEQHLPDAMEDLAAIVRACEQRGTVAVLGTIPPRGWTPDSAPEANFNERVVELCRKLQIPCGYIFEAFQAAGPENRRTYMGDDGVHWRGEGMKLAALAWGRALDQVRFVVRDQP